MINTNNDFFWAVHKPNRLKVSKAVKGEKGFDFDKRVNERERGINNESKTDVISENPTNN